MISGNEPKVIWTIGHSTHPLEEFIGLLDMFEIKTLADIRSLPGSRHYPHFNKEKLAVTLPQNGIGYIHLENLGGRRRVRKDSVNLAWEHPAFRGYADYMETDSFQEAIRELEKIAHKSNTAYMCAEVLWWRCHRSLVSDWLKLNGWKVIHILGNGKWEEHPYTKPARIVNGKLDYTGSAETGGS